jgi:hypothetical protein
MILVQEKKLDEVKMHQKQHREGRRGIRKHMLIKDDISGDKNTTRATIKTLVTLMYRTIAEENTHLREKF